MSLWDSDVVPDFPREDFETKHRPLLPLSHTIVVAMAVLLRVAES